jgi:predicted TPR repeat methyltransferase
LSAHLCSTSETFDLIVSADTLVYFGDLKAIVAAFAGALRPNGLLVFTLERAAADTADAGFRLELHGRYSHAQAYFEQLRQRGFGIVNLDATIIAQAPKMAPHIPAMLAVIARKLGIAESQINIKAKTSERLGFTGRGEGIAAQAVALIEAVSQQPVTR